MAEHFEITNILERFRITAAGEVLEVFEVQFKTTSGIRASVDIPKNEFTAEEAKRRVSVLASELEKVKRM